jgi:PDZ domain-containing protein
MPRSLKAVLTLAAVLLAIVAGTLVWALSAQSDDFAFVPRAAQPALGAVTLEDQPKAPEGAGSVWFSTVGVRHATIWETWFGIDGGGELVPRHALISPGESEEDRSRLEAVSMDASQVNAEIVALRALGEEIDVRSDGVRIVGIDPTAPILADGAQLGDVIVAVDGVAVATTAALRAAIARAGADTPIALELRRPHAEDPVAIETTTLRGPKGEALLGIVPSEARTVSTERSVEYAVDGVGGPSAGLAFALQIYSAGRDYANLGGLKVAATGTLSEVGKVGSIGGAAQKAIGAGRVDADLFLVPRANYAAAAAAAPAGVDVVAVSSFEDALAAIARAATA